MIRETLEDMGADGKTIIKMDLQERGQESWSGLIWLRNRTSAGFLWMRWWTSGSHKMRGNYVASWGTVRFSIGLSFMKLVIWVRLLLSLLVISLQIRLLNREMRAGRDGRIISQDGDWITVASRFYVGIRCFLFSKIFSQRDVPLYLQHSTFSVAMISKT